MNVHIIGRGKLGRAFAAGARESRLTVRTSPGQARAFAASRARTLYILAVPDAAIAKVSERLASVVRAGDIVIHCSGNRGPEELQACEHRAAFTACVHPMLSFASAKHLTQLAGSVWIARGHPRAVLAAQKLARAVSARCIAGPAGQPAYHAAAALLANGSAALSDVFVELLESLGLKRRSAELAAAGMLRSIANNVEHVGVPAALTGPVRRGDADTVHAHLESIAALAPELAPAYRDLSALILRSAQRAGLGSAQAARVADVLASQRRKHRELRYKGKPTRKRPK